MRSTFKRSAGSFQGPRLSGSTRFLLLRVIGLAGTLFALLIAAFMLVHLIPGDPARRIAGLNASPQYVMEIHARLGLDRPLIEQFASYVNGVVHLDFGESFVTGEPVVQVLAQRLRYTGVLAASGLIIMITLGVPFGLLAAALAYGHRHPKGELISTAAAAVGGAIPEILAATVLAAVFGVWLRLLPVAGAQGWTSVILPALAISVRPAALLARVVRVETLNVLSQDYIRTARSKRLPARALYLRHVLPNVLTPVLTLSGVLFSSLLGGAIIVENVFAWPGLGVLLSSSVLVGDYPVIQGTVLVLGVAVVAVNTIVDSILRVVDPRSLLAR